MLLISNTIVSSPDGGALVLAEAETRLLVRAARRCLHKSLSR